MSLIQDCVESEKSLLVDKTREMGVTWSMIDLAFWGWLFLPRFSALVGSITEDKIDSKNNPNTLFWKFDYLLECLKWQCDWLYPEGYNKSKENRSHMKAYNPGKQATFLGEPMGPNFGRSGRVRMILCDEFAEAINPSSTYAACSRTSNTRFIVYTPKGMNFAGRLANPGYGKDRTIPRVTMHWLIDETKNAYEVHLKSKEGLRTILGKGHGAVEDSLRTTWQKKYANLVAGEKIEIYYPWYEQAKRSVNDDPLLIAQELDVNYNESAEGQMYPQLERAAFSKVEYDRSLKLYCTMDYGLSDCTALIWFQIDPSDPVHPFKIIDAYQNRGKTIRWYVPFITGKDLSAGDMEGGYSRLDLEVIESHKRFMGRYAAFFGDPAGKQKTSVSTQSVIDVLADFNIYVETNDRARGFTVRQQALAEALPYCEFNEMQCSDLIQAIRDSRLNPAGKPIHGPESHYRSSLEYGFVNLPGGYIKPDVLIYENYGKIAAGTATQDQLTARALRQLEEDILPLPNSLNKDGKRPRLITIDEYMSGQRRDREESNPFNQIDAIRKEEAHKEERAQKIAQYLDRKGRGFRSK